MPESTSAGSDHKENALLESAQVDQVVSISPNDDAAGLVSNEGLTENEFEEFWASPNLLAEEEKAKHLREAKEHDPVQETAAPAVLDDSKFKVLDTLLEQTDMFSKFLSEQMIAMEDQHGAPAESTGENEEPQKGKRGKGKGAKPQAKKVKLEEKSKQTSTQELCPLLTVDLRDYQQKGVKWLVSLYQNGLNGILADQMGLGKTIQTIGFLSHLVSKGVVGPYMVVGPLSVLANWVNEFNRFCPTMKPVMYHGSRADRASLRAEQLAPIFTGKNPGDAVMPVLITSYEIVIQDVKFLQKAQFKYIVVDEGHRLKNFNCKLIRELRTIPANNKLLLSGTPLQNNLAELWSLLNFIMPDVFNSLANFESWFDFSGVVGEEGMDKAIIAAEQRGRVVSKLHSILKPFVLRRVKADVEIALPRKLEIILYATMAPAQRKLNQQLLDGTLMEEMSNLAAKEYGRTVNLAKLNNVLMQMRKNCNHPDLITSTFTSEMDYPSPEELRAQCGKLALMDDLLKQLHANGHKVLIFSQMTKMLDLIQVFLEQQGHRACRIDGSIPWQERQANIQDFNENKDVWVFLLSTRAGGLGINLVSADTVIIYDSDWNPHQDMQAMDRCHRIGQTKPVLVLRLATAHSVEGKMLRRAGGKMMLERVVIKKGAFKEHVMDENSEQEGQAKLSGGMSANELLELLRSDFAMDDIPQSGVVPPAMMLKLLDRTHLAEDKPLPFPPSGVGYEVVAAQDTSLLTTVE